VVRCRFASELSRSSPAFARRDIHTMVSFKIMFKNLVTLFDSSFSPSLPCPCSRHSATHLHFKYSWYKIQMSCHVMSTATATLGIYLPTFKKNEQLCIKLRQYSYSCLYPIYIRNDTPTNDLTLAITRSRALLADWESLNAKYSFKKIR
jgi:hypothetical protein